MSFVCAGPAVGIPSANTASCLRMLQSSLADVKNIVDGTELLYYINTVLYTTCTLIF